MNKKTILIIISLIVIAFIVFQNVKENGPEYTLVEVIYGTVSQEVSETGQVQMGDSIKLGFKKAGTIERIYVQVGDKVWLGSNLAKLNTTSLLIERSEAQASLEVAQAKLNQLLEGATPEEIQLAQTTVNNAQITLIDAQQDFAEDLIQAYEDALNTLDKAYLKGAAALTTITSIRKSYFSSSDQESITVGAKEDNIGNLLAEIKESIDNDDVDAALSATKDSLSDIYDDLNVIREMTEVANYADIVSATDKASLDTERLNINTALTNIINAQQTITSTKLSGEASVNTAQGKFNKAKDELTLKTAQPSQTNIDLYQAQVKQVQAKVDLLDNQIWETTLRSPVQGQVVKINKEVGETWQPSLTESVITLLPASPYEIKVDIYEEDIVKMLVGNDVNISLIAFPDEVFQGKVITINPAEELIESVVYYTVTINFTKTPEGIRPGMTADLMIKTDTREDVLVIPEDAIEEKDNKNIVRVCKDNQIEDREIEIGLVGSDDMVEVISGLTEGEKVIVE